jgi:hypothetical protein
MRIMWEIPQDIFGPQIHGGIRGPIMISSAKNVSIPCTPAKEYTYVLERGG